MISVVVSTYRYPRALELVLRALAEQDEHDFEVIVTEDSREHDTRDVVASWRARFGDRLTHVRQEDVGMRVARARNLGALSSRGDHLAFLDGDCVPRRPLLRTLRRTAKLGWFAATYRYKLSPELTERAVSEGSTVHRWGLADYMRRRGQIAGYPQWLLPRDRRRIGARKEFVPPYDSFGFIAVARSDFAAVNGYDMRYTGWGGEDVDLAWRLRHHGLRCGWPGPSATLFHLWHPSRKDHEKRYLPQLRECRAQRRVEAIRGLRELEAELRSAEVSLEAV